MPETERKAVTKKINESEASMLDRFKLEIITDANAVQDQTTEAESDMRFLNVIGGMWEDFFDKELENRVKLQFPMISKFLNMAQAEWNKNRVGVEYKPGDHEETSEKDADLLNGIYRSDFRRRGTGKKAIDNAVLEVMHCGYGCFQLGEDFIDGEDPENDLQRIEMRSIFNAYNTVYWDEGSQEIDKSDASRVTKLKRFSRKSFLKEYPDEDPVSAFDPLMALQFNTFSNSSSEQAVYVATRYEVIVKHEKMFVYGNLDTGELQVYNEEKHKDVEDELKQIEFLEFIRERKVLRSHVEKSVFSGAKFFKTPTRISGQFIPIIPMFGHRIYVDGTEWYKGFVRDMKDASRLLNQQLSQLSENAASSPTEKPIFDPEQMVGMGIKEIWADPSQKPYFLANALRDADGNPIAGGGPIGYVKASQLDGSTAALLQLVPQLIQEFTGSVAQETVDPDASGKAIVEARKIFNMNTQPVMENISVAIEWSGVVYASKASELYTTPRIIRTIGKDGSESTVQLQKLVQDEQTGKLIESNTIDGKRFRAYADIGPQYDTQRQETVDTSLKMIETLAPIQGAQQFIPELVGVAIENMAGTGLDSIKKMNRRIRLLAGTVDPENDEEKALIAQNQQNQENETQKKLAEAVTQQQLSEARNLDAASAEKIQSAQLKAAQTQKTLADIQIEQAKTASDIRVNEAKTLKEIRESILKPLEKIPVAP